jgi:hypothetical protein
MRRQDKKTGYRKSNKEQHYHKADQPCPAGPAEFERPAPCSPESFPVEAFHPFLSSVPLLPIVYKK